MSEYISDILSGNVESSSATTESTTVPAQQMINESILPNIQQVALENAQRKIAEAAPQLLQNLENYAQAYSEAVLAGQNPTAIPAVTVFREDGSELTKIDAKNRGFRTLLQGFGIDVLFAIIGAIGALSGVNFFDKAGLATLGILVSKTIVQTAVSYAARMKITPQYQANTVVAQRISP
jgi:hypothetical protein